MKIVTMLILFGICTALPGIAADMPPAKGRLLVATELVRGSDFEESVILLLQYDERGAAGLIINKPTGAAPRDAMPELAALQDYDGGLYYGGPVGLNSIQALLRSASAPDPATSIVDDIYIVPINETTVTDSADAASLRFYVGYAGWGPGQLDGEIVIGSWNVVSASGESVFTNEPENLWRKLAPPETLRASLVQRTIFQLQQ